MSDLDYARLPATRGAAGALIQSDDGRLLLVRRTYAHQSWGIPGGIIEDGESPLAACRRELREELGVEPDVGALAAIDWVPAEGQRTAALQWLFTAALPAGAPIELPAEELSEFAWVRPGDVPALLAPHIARRLSTAAAAATEKTPVYLEDGHPVL